MPLREGNHPNPYHPKALMRTASQEPRTRAEKHSSAATTVRYHQGGRNTTVLWRRLGGQSTDCWKYRFGAIADPGQARRWKHGQPIVVRRFWIHYKPDGKILWVDFEFYNARSWTIDLFYTTRFSRTYFNLVFDYTTFESDPRGAL